jgi:hypothetical protein
MHSNALLYSCYAVTGTLIVQTLEQWQDQPINIRKKEGEQLSTEESFTEMGKWKWSWQFRSGNDPNVKPIKDASEPYYNLAISAYRDSPPEDLLGMKRTTSQRNSVDESGLYSDRPGVQTPDAQICECHFNIDLARVAGMMSFAIFFQGPANAMLYPFYHRVFGATSAGVNRSVLFDQIVYMPLVSIPACWYLNGFVKKWAMRDPRLDESRKDWDVDNEKSLYSIEDYFVETTHEMKERWVSTVLLTMAIWTPTESINLRFVPLHLRSAVAGAVGLIWTTGMAAWTNAGSRSFVESSIKPSMESSVDSWVANLLMRVAETNHV